jgi:hypothetical protein
MSTSEVPRRQYLSVSSFELDFFTHTVSLNASYQTVGTLTAVTGATAANCPKSRVLRENGRKLYPDANPGITVYMVGVYDAITELSGFIDPNSPVFTILNTDKPNYLANSTDPGVGGLVDKANPVYTNSSVDAGTFITAGTTVTAGTNITATAGSITATAGSINAGTFVTAQTGLRTVSGQIMSAAVPTITASANGNYYLNVGASQVSKVVVSGATTALSLHATTNGTVGGSNLTTLAGAVSYVLFDNPYTRDVTITLGNQIRETNPLVLSNANVSMTFVCDGISLFETARTTPLTIG